MIDIAALKCRLSDPREVARLLGLRIMSRGRNEVRAHCPVHGGKSASLRLRNKGDGLKFRCFGCGIYGDAIDLIGAMEGDPKRGLARAQELVGGGVAREYRAEPEPARMDPDAYHGLATRIIDAGKLDGRPWVRPVEEYLASRGLLELARGDEWAALPRFESLPGHPDELIAAKLARWDRNGELVASWPGHRLVIPWRGPDGRICALQRRVMEKAEGPKYVLPWAPEWPYGSERLGENANDCARTINGDPGGISRRSEAISGNRYAARERAGDDAFFRTNGSGGRTLDNLGTRIQDVAIVEGAVDTLALRALHPRFAVLGVPGINGWRASWAALAGGAPRIALDRGKPDPHGIVQEDRAAARIALDCAGRGQETERVLEWWLSRYRRGRALGCVLCGAGEAWLCGACGRRRAPEGMDWGEVWRGRSAR